MFDNFKQKDIFWVVPIITLCLAILPMPIGFYTLTRIIICGSSVYFAYNPLICKFWFLALIICYLIIYQRINTTKQNSVL